jgi:hypothetical protein
MVVVVNKMVEVELVDVVEPALVVLEATHAFAASHRCKTILYGA